MRREDYRRLARLSLMSRKKTTIQTILGISFGLVLLFPTLFVAIAFYGGFSAEINNRPSYRAMNISYSDLDTVSGRVFCNEKYQSEIDNITGIKTNLKYEHYYINNSYNKYVSYSLNGGEPVSLSVQYYTSISRKRHFGLQVIDKECAHTPFIGADYEYANKPLLAGTTFSSGNSMGEIMVSSKFLFDTKLEAEQVVGSTLSLYNYVTVTGEYSSSPDEIVKPDEYKESVQIPYFKNFRIVGVYNSSIYRMWSPRYHSLEYDMTTDTPEKIFSRDYFWISSDSVGEYPHRIARQKQNGDELVNEVINYYEDTPSALAEKVTDVGYAFLPVGLGVFSKAKHLPTFTKTQIIEFSSFESARYGYDNIFECYRKSVTGNPDNITIYKYVDDIAPEGFFVYQSFFDRFFFLCLGLGVFGGIIFLATLLNLVNTLHFTTESMKGFLGICRAQGLKKKDVVRIFFNQFSYIFMWGYTCAIILGGSLCIAIKLIFDKAVREQISEDSAMNFTLQWWYIPIALGALLVVTTVLSVVVSHLLVRKVNKTPVLEILSEENRM